MEFLDPKEQKSYLVRLIIGYVLVGMALILTTIILLYQAKGFGLKNGEVIQNGLIFVSSRPNGADITINGKKYSDTTSARMLLPAGQYTFELTRPGYIPWRRAVTVDGGSVGRFDYPVLFPAELKPVAVKNYATTPQLVTESGDQHWLLVQNGIFNNFDMFDTTKPKDQPVQLTVPLSSITLKTGAHSWRVVEWASDNKHVLLVHSNGVSNEYILLDRQNPDQSVNLTTTLHLGAMTLQLSNKKYDHFYIYSAVDKTLSTATLANVTPQLMLEHVLAYVAHDDKRILYATDTNAAAGKAWVMLKDDTKIYPVRQVTAGSDYLLDIANYSNDWYVVVGSPLDDRTYIYKDVAAVLSDEPKTPLVPTQVFKQAATSFVSFSNNARFIVAQSADHFAVYDAETNKSYAYNLKVAIDPGQSHAQWMDGYRLMLVSNGHELIFDFDDANQNVLTVSSVAYTALFDQKYAALYTVAPKVDQPGVMSLIRTPLLTPADQ